MRACARTGRSMRPPDPEASPLAQIQKLLLHPDVSVQRAALDALQVDIFFMSSFPSLLMCMTPVLPVLSRLSPRDVRNMKDDSMVSMFVVDIGS